MFSTTRLLALGLILSLQSACVPAFLDKYKREEVRTQQQRGTAQTAAAPGTPSASGRRTPGIQQISDGVFRVPLSYDRTWDAVVDVLLRNYNLQIVEKSTGILTTEWDSFYLDGKVHRNKLSLRLKTRGNQGVDLTVHNNVEVLSRVPDGVSEIWLPSDRTKPEIGRIIQNLAIQSGQPKPTLTAEYQPATEAPKPTGNAAQ
ncbi:MAG: hypothetical protein EOP10_04910 [Proteobacteria bacterium]|nr:MAG: hypothetical protein EOP10_04910 [Pseudomonadota bacterium]